MRKIHWDGIMDRYGGMARFSMPVKGKTLITAVAVATGTFLALGTVTALWDNPLFVRMTPAGTVEIFLLAAQSILLGVYFSMPRRACAKREAGVGSVMIFLGVACPVCNKILLYVFGSELLLIYFEPARLYVALAGFLITGLAVWLKWTKGGYPSLTSDTA